MLKKIRFKLSLVTILIVLLSSFVFAASGDDIIENYIDNYEDYESLFEEVNGGTQYTQDELKEGYEKYQEEIRAYYKSYIRDDIVKAEVIEALEPEEYYEYNEYYYSFSKYDIQPITVKVLEGENKGDKYSFEYLLTGDTLNNIRYAELKKGDTLFVSIKTNEETGELYADITSAGSNVDRLGIVVVLGIVALALLTIYGGKKGLITALMIVLILDFCLVIIPNMGYMGLGFLIGGILLIVALTACISLSKLGMNKKSLNAIGISIAMVLLTWLLIMLASYITRTAGITFETAAISENVILGNMNFENLYIITTLIIASIFITNIVCKAISKISESNVTNFNEKTKLCQDVLQGNTLVATVCLLTLYIPNHLLLLTNKYNAREIWNSEILVVELIRLFVIIISLSLTVPTTAVLYDNKKKETK